MLTTYQVNESPAGYDNLFTWLLALSGLANFFIWGSQYLERTILTNFDTDEAF